MKIIIRRAVIPIILLTVFAAATTVWAGGGNVIPQLETDEAVLQRFTDMRFGTLMHWGPAVLHNAEISWSMGNRVEYEKCYQNFKPTKFNADEWASLEHIGINPHMLRGIF